MEATELLGCVIDRWTNVWGDPIIRGAVTMVIYGMAGLLICQVSRLTVAEDRWLWRVCAIVFFFQVVNTHLDLHALPTAFGHCISKAQGWYREREPVKLAAVVMIATATTLILVWATVAWWRSIRSNALLIVGVGLAVGFTLMKGTGLNVAERFYNVPVGLFRRADLMEYFGVALASLAALMTLRRLRRQERAARAVRQ